MKYFFGPESALYKDKQEDIMKKIILLLIIMKILTACSGQQETGVAGESCGTGQAFFDARFVDQENLTAIGSVNLSVSVSPGEQLGLVGQPGLASGFDWGIIDTRVNNFYVNSQRQQNFVHIACPIDYFTSDLKAELEALTGRTEGPLCGEVAYDVAGTAQGIWVLESQQDFSYIEQYGLTLGIDHQNPLEYVIGIVQVGSDNDSSTIHFTLQSSGLIDRDFADVTADGQIYCYNNWVGRVLIQLDSDGTLLFETQNQTCSSPGYSFTSSQLWFVR